MFLENVDGFMINYGIKYFSVYFWIDNGEIWVRLMERFGGVFGVVLWNFLNYYLWNFIGFFYDYVIGV